jgi:urease accessory protein
LTDVPQSAGWQASLHLGFAKRGERTTLYRREHRGPLRVQRAFYPEACGVCHVILLHPPGGVVGGDRLQLHVQVDANAHALVTTPGASKLYRSAGPVADSTQNLNVAAGGCFEWLPQETIAFAGARAHLTTRVQLAADARFIGWEITCLGRPACGERFERGELSQRIELWRRERPLFVERAVYRGGGASLVAPWGLAGQPVVGTFLCAVPQLQQLALGDLARGALAASQAAAASDRVSVSCMGEVLVARYLGPSTERARACFTQLWQLLRSQLVGQPAITPRIWLT